MTSFLEVETADLVDAARTMCLQVAEPVDRAVGGLATELEGLGAMAGGDPGARQWAASYDRAAHTALRAGVDVTNACYRIATMFGRSARNYEAADSASAARTRHAAAAAVQRLPYDGELLMSAALPSAAGGSGGGPPGWGLVQSAVGYVWPDGHQDRLHAAAAAWSHSASVLDDHAFTASLPALDFLRDRLPEGDDVVTVCQAMRGHLTELADVHRSLGDTCTELAHHIDTAHSAIISELEWMLGESAVLQGLGAAISAVTAGGAEAPTQGIEAGRIAKAVTAIKGFIHTFLTAVRALAARVGRIAVHADRIAGEVVGLNGVRLSVAGVNLARGYTPVLRARELLATNRYAERWRSIPRYFSEAGQLQSKFKHAKSFGVLGNYGKKTVAEYDQAIQAFLSDPNTVRILGRYHGNRVWLSYNPDRGLVVVQRMDGRFVTGWAPGPRAMWNIRVRRTLGGG